MGAAVVLDANGLDKMINVNVTKARSTYHSGHDWYDNESVIRRNWFGIE